MSLFFFLFIFVYVTLLHVCVNPSPYGGLCPLLAEQQTLRESHSPRFAIPDFSLCCFIKRALSNGLVHMGVRSGRWIIRAIEFPSPHISQGTPSPLLYESKTAEEEKSFFFPFSSSPFHLKQGKGMVVTFFSCGGVPARLASTKWIFDVERGADWGRDLFLVQKKWGGESRVHFWQPPFLSLPRA